MWCYFYQSSENLRLTAITLFKHETTLKIIEARTWYRLKFMAPNITSLRVRLTFWFCNYTSNFCQQWQQFHTLKGFRTAPKWRIWLPALSLFCTDSPDALQNSGGRHSHFSTPALRNGTPLYPRAASTEALDSVQQTNTMRKTVALQLKAASSMRFMDKLKLS